MKIKIISEKSNPLLKRKEINFELNHSEEGQTSSRLEVKEKLADELKAKPDLVFVEKVETKTGTTIARGEANVYESAEQAKLVEREHIITRNSPPAEPVKEETIEIEAEKEVPEGKSEGEE
ncbi:30S ribosomal protein S24e [Candidatus Bathyarchaeota archaeon]|nr:30S ribosomal protein S24e [Candidatus Bathyarchaeota archaeon]